MSCKRFLIMYKKYIIIIILILEFTNYSFNQNITQHCYILFSTLISFANHGDGLILSILICLLVFHHVK